MNLVWDDDPVWKSIVQRTATEFHFEVRRPPKNWKAPKGLEKCDKVLFRCSGDEVIAGIRPYKRQIQLVDPLVGHDPVIYWSAQLNLPYAEGEFYEIIRGFFFDENEEDLCWYVMHPRLPKFLQAILDPTVTMLRVESTTDGKWSLLDRERNKVLTAHRAWRDSDSERGVLAQFTLPDLNHPLWFEALLTAFAMRP